MSKNKVVICKHCGAEITNGAKICPSCGTKNSIPFYKRIWFRILIVLILCCIVWFSFSGDEDNTSIEYTTESIHDMNLLLENNAMEAEDYTDKYIEISGVIESKDSDGEYIIINCSNYDDFDDECFYSFGICCNICDEDTLATIKPLKAGESITAKIHITDVGELVGYSADIIEIVK